MMIGKWIIVFIEEGYCLIGHIEAAVGDYHFLVKMRPPKCPPFSRIFCIDDITGDNCTIFDNEKELDAWEAFIDQPEEKSLNIVHMKKEVQEKEK